MERQSEKSSLSKALTMLMLFLDSKEELALSDLAYALDLSKPTASRLAATLVEFGFLKQKESRGKFSLGTIYLDFSGLIKSRFELRRVALPPVFRLSRRVHEAVVIAYGDGSGGLCTESYQDISTPGTMLMTAPEENALRQLHFTSLGKIMLANMADQEVEKYFQKNNLVRATPNTIMKLDQMMEELREIREAGIAFDREEHRTGVRSIGVGVRDVERKLVGAIAIVAPAVRLPDDQLAEFADEVRSSASEISRALGYKE
jgi:DNA-binding IclR family transcriptional regulator